MCDARVKWKRICILALLAMLTGWYVPGGTGWAAAAGNKGWRAPDQAEAMEFAHRRVPGVKDVLEEYPGVRRQKLIRMGVGMDDITRTYFWLDSPLIKEDGYAPVRFMHGTHAAFIQDCSICHHARPADTEASETVRCAACHREPSGEGAVKRPGLKAAYHLQCVGCHKRENKGPVHCTGCHLNQVPDHEEFVELSDKPDPFEVTEQCLGCHEEAGEQMVSSAHWLWRGPSPYTFEHRKNTLIGKRSNTLNSF